MTKKLKTLTFSLSLISFIYCGFAQSDKKSSEDRLTLVLNDDEYPILRIDDQYKTSTKGEKVIIPEKTSGFVYVVFDSPHESDYSCCPMCDSDSQNNLIVDIPKSKVLRYSCDSKIHERMLVEGKLQYFKGIYDNRGYLTKRDSINRYRHNENLSIKMNGYQYSEYLSIKSAIENSSDKVDLIFDVNSVVVVPYGFHESFRTIVANILNKKVEGKVAAFQIGTVKDIFKLENEDYERFKK